jgi:signal transduction histidine kinase
MRSFLLCCILLLNTPVRAHDSVAVLPLLADTIRTSVPLFRYAHYLNDSEKKLQLQEVLPENMQHFIDEKRMRIPKDDVIDGCLWISFRLINTSSQALQFYFTAGTLARSTELFYRDTVVQQWLPLPAGIPANNEQAYRLFQITPNTQLEILAKCRFAKTNIIQIRPYLIHENFLEHHILYANSNWYLLNYITYLICGALFLMLLFSLATYLQNRKIEFLHYALYVAMLTLMLFLKALYFKLSLPFNYFNEEFFDYVLLLGGYLFYFRFTRHFLDTRQNHPILHKILKGAELIVATFITTYSFIYFLGGSYKWLNALENFSKYFMLFVGINYVIIGMLQQNKLFKFLVAGNMANLIMGGISQYLILQPYSTLEQIHPLFRLSLFYFEIGILMEMAFFLAGLAYKNRKELIERVVMQETLRQEKERQEYEKELAVLRAQQEERARISADMHDELGSGVTAIRLLSEIALQKAQNQPQEEIRKISANANDLMAKMNAIIWSMNPGHDSLESFIAYMRSYMAEFCEAVQLHCHLQAPDTIPNQTLTGQIRRNLFLVIKESLNNVAKHAKATRVEVEVLLDNGLNICIRDNGTGFDPEKQNRYSNGLCNMRRRIESIGGSFTLQTGAQGTTICLQVPFTLADERTMPATPSLS